MKKRVAVTGVGVVASCGIGVEEFWNGLFNESAPLPIRRVPDTFNPRPLFAKKWEMRRLDRVSLFAVSAADEALVMAGAPQTPAEDKAVVIGCSAGGAGTAARAYEEFGTKPDDECNPLLVPMNMPNAPAAQIGMRWDAQGPTRSVGTACASGATAIGDAFRMIRDGYISSAVAGGAEAGLEPVLINGFVNAGALTLDGRSRPFDQDRDGFAISEGAGVLLLEEWEAAKARGANILAELLAVAETSDAHHITAPDPTGRGAIRCVEMALEDANLAPTDVSHVNAHGTSTSLNDATEAKVINTVFGADVPVTSIKGVTGHALSAAGGIEAVAAVLTLSHQVIPPTLGTSSLDPSLPSIDLVTGTPRTLDGGVIASTSFAFGGHNACVLIAPADNGSELA